MKKTLLTVIITLLAVAGIILISHAIWGEGECIFRDDDDKQECVEHKKSSCCDKEKTMEDGETARMAAEKCPEAHNCKEATEKCKGEMTKEKEENCKEEMEKKCAGEEKKCDEKKEQCE